MRALRCFALILVCLLAVVPARAQKEKREPLTEAQIEQIREAGIDPAERVGLYTKFVDEHVDTIKGLAKRGHSDARSHRLDNELQDLTALMDEFGANIDVYSDRKADIRRTLKPLSEAAPRWLEVLRALAPERGFELSLKEAIESGQDLADQATSLLREQTDYFNTHKDERGQDRAEPK
jgi:hypothetical protein